MVEGIVLRFPRQQNLRTGKRNLEEKLELISGKAWKQRGLQLWEKPESRSKINFFRQRKRTTPREEEEERI